MAPGARHVVVLFHERDRFRDPSSYLVHHLAGFWREDGYRVTYLFGTRQLVPADLVLVHVNLSVVPEPYLKFASRYPIVLNGAVRDIRKSTISTNLVRPGDGWAGPVIVKSDLNYAGAPERFLRRTHLEDRWAVLRSLRRRFERIRGQEDPFGESGDYRVFDRPEDVPREWFANRSLVVEKFRPEVEDGNYFMRMYLFLGDRFLCRRMGGGSPIVKGGAELSSTVDAAAEVDTWRRKFGLDYGKLDYVVNGGEAVLIDVNKTTGATQSSDPEAQSRTRRYQAEGLYSYFS